MAFSPTGTLYLIGGVPLDITYQHTIDFASAQEQLDYFLGCAVQTLNEYTYIRKDSSIKVKLNVEQLYNINYILYRNQSTSKWIYAFITDKNYINDNNTELVIVTDVFQTYMFDYTWHESFIEREHQNRWASVGNPIFNLVDENLTLGDEYLKENETVVAESEKYFLVVTSECIDDNPITATMIQGYPTPFFYYIVPWDSAGTSPPLMDVQTLCRWLSTNPKILSVSWIPFLPFSLTASGITKVGYTWTDAGGGTIDIYRISDDMIATGVFPQQVDKYANMGLPSGFGTGVTRHYKYESKLLCYPYVYHMLTDLMSKPLILKNEYLTGNSIAVGYTQSLGFEMKTKFYITSGYLGENNGKLHSMINNTVNDLPLKTNEYYNYMLTKKAQATTGMALSLTQAVGGVALAGVSGGLGMAVGGGAVLQSVGVISSELAKRKDLQNTPESVRHMGNNLAFDLSDNNTSLKFMRYGIAPSIKKILGDFFGKYGYKCMEVKTPNLRSRYYYNYIKTVGCNIKGDFDNNDLATLKSIFDNGITIWHNHSGVTPLSYSYDNVETSLL
jgi:hypothetical protein